MQATKTNENLLKAAQGEAMARLKYTAFAQQAMEERMPEIAQLFMEAAGAETIHGITHLRAAGLVKSTLENLRDAVEGEADEVDTMYPKMIEEAKEEEAVNKEEAIKAFQVAIDREDDHERMFKAALESLESKK